MSATVPHHCTRCLLVASNLSLPSLPVHIQILKNVQYQAAIFSQLLAWFFIHFSACGFSLHLAFFSLTGDFG